MGTDQFYSNRHAKLSASTLEAFACDQYGVVRVGHDESDLLTGFSNTIRISLLR